ncbi:hypothetical protein [Curtobacterium flaccumfaciens]
MEIKMANEITGRVAQIVSDREVVLNRGERHGVAPGMYFKIMDPSTIDIRDPETDEVIGSISRIKIVLEAVEVADSLTVARTFRSEEVNVGGTGALLGSIMSAPKYVRKVETLRRGEDSPAPLSAKESVVAIGDPFERASADEVENSRSVSLWRPTVPGESGA